MEGLFCNDINMRAAEYASKRYPDRSDHWLWQLVVDAYVEGACSQYNIDNYS